MPNRGQKLFWQCPFERTTFQKGASVSSIVDKQDRQSSQSTRCFQRGVNQCLYSLCMSLFVKLCSCVFVYCVFPLWMHRRGRAVNVPLLVTLTDHQPGHKHGKPHSRDFCGKEIHRISFELLEYLLITKLMTLAMMVMMICTQTSNSQMS